MFGTVTPPWADCESSILCMFVHALQYKCREKNQLDATERFIGLIICSTCFGHLYAHHQELETILVLVPHMVCNAASTKRYNECKVALSMFRVCGSYIIVCLWL